ncbi:MAG: ATP-binding protein, partial [Pseudomonadota bacterium]
FMPVRGAADRVTYQPRVVGVAKLHFVDKSAGVDEWQQIGLATAMSDDGKDALWDEGEPCVSTALTRDPVAGATFADLPAAAQRAANYSQWGKSLAAALYQSQKLQLWSCDSLKLVSKAGEAEGEFRSRLALSVREQRDAEVAKLRARFAPRLATLQGQKQRSSERTERERGQLSQQKFQTAISLGATILGAFLGRKTVSVGNIGRATTAARSASRIGRESQDVQRAEESAEQIDQRIADLNKECEAAIAALETSLDPAKLELRSITVAPRKTDIAVGHVLLLWVPWRTGADGFPAQAS